MIENTHNNKINNIQKLRFLIGGFFSRHSEFIITNNHAVLDSYGGGINSGKYLIEKVIENPDMEKLIEVLNYIGLSDWKDKYDNEYVIDGTQWELEIDFNNGHSKKIYGSNSYPDSPEFSDKYTVKFLKLLSAFDSLLQINHFIQNQ